ncbi:isochorismate synthase MenF [Pseudoalteromonas fenneropenaei]|uniref:isochorismate synthase n=1 Tax=Pseudoalteromonas fenneropenaei TaxID=1737459 RepID=A0ABV7CPN2_9GAMM
MQSSIPVSTSSQPARLSLFSDGKVFLLCEGEFARYRGSAQPQHLQAWLDDAFKRAQESGVEAPLVMGCLPFRHTDKASLHIPLKVRRFSKSQLVQLLKSDLVKPVEATQALAWQEVPTKQHFEQAVSNAVYQLQHTALDKVVLSRTLQAALDVPLCAWSMLLQLIEQNPHAYHFVMQDDLNTHWVGASPELLLEKRGAQVCSNPLAGTAKRVLEPQHDQAIAAQLLNSLKDNHEHAIVIEQVKAALGPYCCALEVPAAPSLISTPQLWHLSSRIAGQLESEQIRLPEVLARLHPTPAVCGTPTNLARTTIEQLEPFEREHFTGTVGWMDSQGNGQWAVTIRCAKVEADKVTLFAGAGVVAQSDPSAEYLETQAKLGTMLRVLEGAR